MTFLILQADKVADTSGWEQFGLALRFVKNNKPVERLVSFYENATDISICTMILNALATSGIDATLCCALAHDGAGCMSGHLAKPSFVSLSPRLHTITVVVMS